MDASDVAALNGYQILLNGLGIVAGGFVIKLGLRWANGTEREEEEPPRRPFTEVAGGLILGTRDLDAKADAMITVLAGIERTLGGILQHMVEETEFQKRVARDEKVRLEGIEEGLRRASLKASPPRRE